MKIIYYIIFFFWYLLSLLPLSVLYVFSDLLYFPIYYCVRYRRRIVRKNLTESFPELSKEKNNSHRKAVLSLFLRLYNRDS